MPMRTAPRAAPWLRVPPSTWRSRVWRSRVWRSRVAFMCVALTRVALTLTAPRMALAAPATPVTHGTRRRSGPPPAHAPAGGLAAEETPAVGKPSAPAGGRIPRKRGPAPWAGGQRTESRATQHASPAVRPIRPPNPGRRGGRGRGGGGARRRRPAKHSRLFTLCFGGGGLGCRRSAGRAGVGQEYGGGEEGRGRGGGWKCHSPTLEARASAAGNLTAGERQRLERGHSESGRV